MALTTGRRPKTKGARGADVSSVLTGRRFNDRGLRTKSRRPGLVSVAALLTIGCGLAFAVLLSQAGNRTEVLAIGHPVAKGQLVERTNLVTRQVAGVIGAIPTDQASKIIGKTASVDLVEGQILTAPMVTSDPVPGKGRALVGLALDPTQVPTDGLKPGDQIRVIAVPGDNGGGAGLDAPPALSDNATIYSVGGGATDGGSIAVTVIVDSVDAGKIAAYSTSKRVAIVGISAADAGAAG